MAIKTVAVSDISNTEIPEDEHTRVVIKHPDFNYLLEIDANTAETEKLTETTLRLVEFTIYAPNVPPRTAVMETKVIDKLFPKFDEMLQGARKAEVSATPGRRGRGPAKVVATKSGDKIDYTAPDRYGQIHRGRITDEESRLVRENRDQASKNRQAQGHSAINWDDPKEAARYGL